MSIIRNENNRVYMIGENGEVIAQILFPDIGQNRVILNKIITQDQVLSDNELNQMLEEVVKRLSRDEKKIYVSAPLAIEWFKKRPEYQSIVWKYRRES